MIEPGENRVIPDPGFAGDDGSAPAALAEVLAGWSRGSATYAEALAVLAASRLLVPVVAVLGEVEYDDQGLAHDKTSDMATVLLQGADGRLALLAFTGTDALVAWNPEGRPVPVATATAARSALQDGAAALVIDVAGPVRFVVEGEHLERLAAGWTLVQVGERADQIAWMRPGDSAGGESSASL